MDDEKICLELDEEAIQYIVRALTNFAMHDDIATERRTSVLELDGSEQARSVGMIGPGARPLHLGIERY